MVRTRYADGGDYSVEVKAQAKQSKARQRQARALSSQTGGMLATERRALGIREYELAHENSAQSR